MVTHSLYMCIMLYVALSPGHSQIYITAMEKNQEKAWDQYYVTDQKWWTWLVCNWTRFHNDGNVPTQCAPSTASDRIVKFT